MLFSSTSERQVSPSVKCRRLEAASSSLEPGTNTMKELYIYEPAPKRTFCVLYAPSRSTVGSVLRSLPGKRAAMACALAYAPPGKNARGVGIQGVLDHDILMVWLVGHAQRHFCRNGAVGTARHPLRLDIQCAGLYHCGLLASLWPSCILWPPCMLQMHRFNSI